MEEYLIDLDATAAYKRAGYCPKNDHSASVMASVLLTNPDVRQAIAAGRAKQSEAAELSAAWVLAELKRHADASPPAVSVRALELIGKHLGMFDDWVNIQRVVKLELVEEIVDANSPPLDPAAQGPG